MNNTICKKKHLYKEHYSVTLLLTGILSGGFMHNEVIEWLLDGDVSIQYLTHTTLLASEASVVESLQKRIEREGYGKKTPLLPD